MATIDMGLEEGRGLLCPFRRGAESPSNTMWLGPRSTSVPSGVFIHPAVWPQRKLAENWGLRPSRELGPHLTQSGQAEAYLHVKFHLDPSNRLVTVYPIVTDRQTDRQTAQRSDSIGRTVLQTVAQKSNFVRMRP